MILTGPRLRLRPWRDEDLPPMAAMGADPAVMRHFPAPLAPAETALMLARIRAHWAAHGWGPWCVERRDAPGCLGMVGLLTIPFDADFTPGVEVLWRIAGAAQGQGLAEEAARLALAAGFGPLGLARIHAFTVPANGPSRRVMEKLGMRPAGGFDHPRLPAGHPLRWHLRTEIDRADWLARRPGD